MDYDVTCTPRILVKVIKVITYKLCIKLNQWFVRLWHLPDLGTASHLVKKHKKCNPFKTTWISYSNRLDWTWTHFILIPRDKSAILSIVVNDNIVLQNKILLRHSLLKLRTQNKSILLMCHITFSRHILFFFTVLQKCLFITTEQKHTSTVCDVIEQNLKLWRNEHDFLSAKNVSSVIFVTEMTYMCEMIPIHIRWLFSLDEMRDIPIVIDIL